MKILKLILAILIILMYGCCSLDVPIHQDLPYGDPDWEFRMMMYDLGFNLNR